MHRQGYRFIAVIGDQPSVVSDQSEGEAPFRLPIPNLVGRESELLQLHSWSQQALTGQRQLVFVTGEAGIGKTAVVDAFIERAREQEGLWIGRGQCIEQYGSGEAYMPVLEALGRLCRQSAGQRLIELFNQYAPTWLVQMPTVLSPDKLTALKHKVTGVTPERMLREMAEAVEAFTAEQPLILVLEDLHWSDSATLELLAMLARRQEPARLLIIGTYRPVEVLVHEQPLRSVKQELQLHGHCQELALEFLPEQAVQEYLANRWNAKADDNASLQDLARFIHQYTDGNPLFMVNMVDYLIRQGLVVETDNSWELYGRLDVTAVGVPDSLWQMIEVQLSRTTQSEQQVLEAASVAGTAFSAAAVAAGLGQETGEIEEVCAGLARREQFVREHGTEDWPDGTVAAQYRFVHALYQETLYERVPVGRRAHLHQRIGEREEAAYGERAGEIAAELAMHFERGREYVRAVQYRHQAGENALQRSAYQEAMVHLTKGLELLTTLPDTPERAQQELRLQMTLGSALLATRGFGDPAVEEAYLRAEELCQQLGEPAERFGVLAGLWSFYTNRTQYTKARKIAERYLQQAEQEVRPYFLTWGHHLMAEPLFALGELSQARMHGEHAIAVYDAEAHRPDAARFGGDPKVMSCSHTALVLWLLGYPDRALKRCKEGLGLARELGVPFALTYALICEAFFHLLRRDGAAAQALAEEVIAVSTQHGFATRIAQGTIYRGGAFVLQGHLEEGIALLQQGLTATRASGSDMLRSHYLGLLVEAYAEGGQVAEGCVRLNEAFQMVDTHAERVCEAELYRLKGELFLNDERGMMNDEWRTRKVKSLPHATEAEECFQNAIEIARNQNAKSWELRAATSLARVWQQQGKKAEAFQLLSEIHDWFTEGFDTVDLQAAKVLIEELNGA